MENMEYAQQPEPPYELIEGKKYYMSNEPDYELIGGERFYISPAPNLNHSTVVSRLTRIFWNYIDDKMIDAVVYGDNTDVYLSKEEHYRPDVSVVCNPEIINNGKYVNGAPDLIVEVLSPSTMKNDVGIKKYAYEKNGVKEYWIVDPWSKRIEVYHLIDGKYIIDDVYKIADYDDNEDEIKTLIKVSIFEDLVVDINKIFSWRMH